MASEELVQQLHDLAELRAKQSDEKQGLVRELRQLHEQLEKAGLFGDLVEALRAFLEQRQASPPKEPAEAHQATVQPQRRKRPTAREAFKIRDRLASDTTSLEDEVNELRRWRREIYALLRPQERGGAPTEDVATLKARLMDELKRALQKAQERAAQADDEVETQLDEQEVAGVEQAASPSSSSMGEGDREEEAALTEAGSQEDSAVRVWAPDTMHCQICEQAFFPLSLRRRHHCRVCGLCLCSTCAGGMVRHLEGVVLKHPVWGEDTWHRVCKVCATSTG